MEIDKPIKMNQSNIIRTYQKSFNVMPYNVNSCKVISANIFAIQCNINTSTQLDINTLLDLNV